MDYAYTFLLLSPPPEWHYRGVIMHAVHFGRQKRGSPVGRERTCDWKKVGERGKYHQPKVNGMHYDVTKVLSWRGLSNKKAYGYNFCANWFSFETWFGCGIWNLKGEAGMVVSERVTPVDRMFVDKNGQQLVNMDWFKTEIPKDSHTWVRVHRSSAYNNYLNKGNIWITDNYLFTFQLPSSAQ